MALVLPVGAVALADNQVASVLADPAAVADAPVDAIDYANTERLFRALALIGTPYHARGTSPETGFDCSGFVGYVFRSAGGIELPRTADGMFRLPVPERAQRVERADIQPGDLLFFRIGHRRRHIDHVAIALGEGRFVHAPASGGQVRVESLDMPYWSRHFVGARRISLATAMAPTGTGDGEEKSCC